jgi:hypothetical protein
MFGYLLQAINANTPWKMKAGADRGAIKTLPEKCKPNTNVYLNRKMSLLSRVAFAMKKYFLAI